MYRETAHFYDLFDVDDPSTLWHADFLARHLPHTTSGSDISVLDVGAGNARAAMLLAERGATVTCVEPSDAMRMIALGRIADDNTHDARLTLLPGNIETLKLESRFDLVAACHVLYFLPDDALVRGLDRLRAHVAPHGRLVGDFALAHGRATHDFRLAAERVIGDVTYRKHTASQAVAHNRWRITWAFESIFRDAVIEHVEESFDVHTRDAEASRALLTAHGFTLLSEHADYGGAPWRGDADSSRYVFVAKAA
jgi:SAM-dependent methyltransferase